MEIILLDWTRMGNSYCLAGVIVQEGPIQVVRPLPAKHFRAEVRNLGWSPWAMDGHARWEMFEVIGPRPARPEPPHLEDLWVRTLRSLQTSASLEQRRSILEATAVRLGEPVFGIPLSRTRSALYLPPGTGRRSLATLVVPAHAIDFSGSHREGSSGPDIRVHLRVPGPGDRTLPVKDHHLLLKAESGRAGLEEQIQRLNEEVHRMGELVAIRLGLSRPFVADGRESPRCWLMADGFFSFSHPQA
ncbi:MAG: hypothetical protein JO112_04285 [Planctomycetes bacterium]|nr:hypothetical protein [Planctomycetota bacterium]